MKEDFKRDLSHLLNTQEKLFQANCDHVDYVRAYKYFIDQWCPKESKNKEFRSIEEAQNRLDKLMEEF